MRGPEGLKLWVAGSLAAFADHGFVSTVGPLASGNMIVGRWVFRAVYRDGATGGRVEHAGVDILRVRHGKIGG